MALQPGVGPVGVRHAPQGASRVGWQPQWLHHGRAPAGTDLVRAWRRFVLDHPAASIHFLPDIALLRGQNTHEPVVYAHWRDGGELAALAILPTRTLKLSIIPGVCTELPGRRLMDNALITDGAGDASDAFAHDACTLMDSPGMDCLILTDVDVESPLRNAFKRVAKQGHLLFRELAAASPYWWIRFPERAEDYWAQFSKKSRYNFRYRAKHLDHSVRSVRSAGEVEDYARRVDELIGRTWQHRRLGYRLEIPQKVELWRAMADLGAFRSYLLQQGDRTIAFATGFQWKGRFTYEETGYDPEFAAKSPGQVLLYRVVEDLIARDTPRLLDFGYGDNEYKRIYANHQTLSGPLVVVRNAVVPCMTVRAAQLRSAVGRTTRTVLTRAGVMSLIRHLHRGHLRLGKQRPTEAATPAADGQPT